VTYFSTVKGILVLHNVLFERSTTLYPAEHSPGLTDECLDAQGLYLHVDQQRAAVLHQDWGQGNAGLGVGKLDHLCGDAVDEAGVRLDGTFSPIFLND
jgi:hypothetical protein